jgi:PBSX family phage terminase large subunit
VIAAAPEQRRTLALFPRQRRFVQDTARYPASIGGIGSGKTFVGAAKVISRINRKELGLVCAPTYKILRDATQRTLFEMLRELGVEYQFNKGDNHLTVPATGHEIIFRSLDDPDNLRGPNVSYAWIDEAAYISADAWRVVKGRTRVGDLQQAWITGTPKGRNWIWDEWVKNADDRHTMYRFRTGENPTPSPDFVQSLGYEGKFAQQELGGEFVSFEGLVYSAFDREKSVHPVDTTGWRTVGGVDVGARNPTAVLTVCVAGDERVHIAREFYQRNLGSTDILSAIESESDRAGFENIYIDPSAAAYITDLLNDGYPATKANNDVQTGIQRVSSVIPRLTVDPSCVHTIAEFESYQYPDEDKANNDKPLKQNDHAMDALRYALMGALEPTMDIEEWYTAWAN